MQVNVKCEDCGRPLGRFVRLNVGKKDVEVKVHGCYHTEIYDHIKELKAEIVQLKKHCDTCPILAGHHNVEGLYDDQKTD